MQPLFKTEELESYKALSDAEKKRYQSLMGRLKWIEQCLYSRSEPGTIKLDDHASKNFHGEQRRIHKELYNLCHIKGLNKEMIAKVKEVCPSLGPIVNAKHNVRPRHLQESK